MAEEAVRAREVEATAGEAKPAPVEVATAPAARMVQAAVGWAPAAKTAPAVEVMAQVATMARAEAGWAQEEKVMVDGVGVVEARLEGMVAPAEPTVGTAGQDPKTMMRRRSQRRQRP
jgi:hypothetical protein